MERARGQVIVIFVVGLAAMLAMAGLLFDGGHALVLRRQLQDAGDAAALAGANLTMTETPIGCSATPGPPPGAPRASIVTAVQNRVRAVLGSTFPLGNIQVSCPDGWNNYVVQVDLQGTSPSYFGGIVGMNGFHVATTSQAVNGQMSGLFYSVVELDPGNPTWPNGRRGCPSVLVSGGPTVILDGNMMIDSACSAAMGGPLGTNGNAASISLTASTLTSLPTQIHMVGDYVPGVLTITPTPVQHDPPLDDPLKNLPDLPVANLTSNAVQSTSQLVLGGSDVVLNPGVYIGGIKLKNTVQAFLRPGVYIMQGGGFDIGAQNAVYSVANLSDSAAKTTTDANWSSKCPTSDCGVLIYNTGTTSTFGALSVGAGATLRLRPYQPSADLDYSYMTDASGVNIAQAFEYLLFWQDKNPAPTNTYQQPDMNLSGGGTVDMSGTVYAPSAKIYMTGGSGGSGGTPTNLTIQFISWDLQLNGNTSFHFYYQSNAFADPPDYGLIK